MDIQDLKFFVSIFETSFVDACVEHGIDKNEAIKRIVEMQKYLGFDLFLCDLKTAGNITVSDLTENSKTFLKLAIRIINNISENIVGVFDDKSFDFDDTVLIVQSSFSSGKNIVLPVMLQMQNNQLLLNKHINLVTHRHLNKTSFLNTHVILDELSENDEIFFQKRWSAIIGQKLYATSEYLNDVGNSPKKPEDLFVHSILAHGTFANIDYDRKTNWHISGCYGLPKLEPSIMLSSMIVLVAAVEENLGIGPVIDCYSKEIVKNLIHILPDITGPDMLLDFAVRKHASTEILEFVDFFEEEVLKKMKEFEIEIVYH